MTADLIVNCDWLNQKIEAGLNDIVIIDVSWSSTKDCFEEYKRCHIPGARYINIMDADHTEMYPRNISNPDRFTSLVQQAGISNSTHVVVYSTSDKAGYFIAGRGWWTFKYFGHQRVSILDGGLTLWKKKSLPTTDVVMQVEKPGDFVSKLTLSVYASYEEIVENVATPKFQLVDTRPAQAHTAGQIPGSLNIPMDSLIDLEENKLKDKDELLSILQRAGVALDQPIVAHCNSGMSSCTVTMVAQLLGQKDARLYHGGFTEWSKKQALT